MKSLETEQNLIETEFLNFLTTNSKNGGKGVTKSEIIKKINISEKYYDRIISDLLAKNLIKINADRISYTTPVNDSIIILKGDLLFPVTIIEREDYKLVTRGIWYKLPKNFDVRRIIWDCELYNNGNNKNNSLVDLLISQEFVVEKSENNVMKEYNHLIDKMIPYSDNLYLHIKSVNTQSTDILITFDMKLTESDKSFTAMNAFFKVKSEISTGEMLNELNKESSLRNFQNIKLNNVISVSDLILKNNEIPIEYVTGNGRNYVGGDTIKYVYIETLKNGITYSIKTKNSSGSIKTIENYEYNSITEGIESIMVLCKKFIDKIFSQYGLVIDE